MVAAERGPWPRLREWHKFRNPEHPDAFHPSSLTPCCISGAILFELLICIICENFCSERLHAPPRTLIALRHAPGLHPDHERVELGGISYVDQTSLRSLCCLSCLIRASDSCVSATQKLDFE